MRCFVTGGSGFIGSTLVDRLLLDGHSVVVYDKNERTRFIADALSSGRCQLVQKDILDRDAVTDSMSGSDIVFHLAARADVRFSSADPGIVFEQNSIGTFNVVEAARRNGVKAIMFASTGSIYGEPTVFPTPEDAPFPLQTSIYGASKLSGEGLLQAYAEAFGVQVFIFRFVSNVGERYTHGHILDFYRKLSANPHSLDVLGNGFQRKSYVYVGDTVDGILTAVAHAKDKVNIFNLGTDDYCTVRDSLGWICEHLDVNPEFKYAGGERGWSGDSPFIYLDCRRLRDLGWEPKLTIKQGIIRTVEFMQASPWLTTTPKDLVCV